MSRRTRGSRGFVAVVEAGVGFGFLAVVIGYLPVLYQAFSRREAIISLLDARASSPPSATEMLKRHSEGNRMIGLVETAGRLGNLGIGTAGKPSLLSCPDLLPLSA